MKFSIKDFFSKCDQIHSFLRIWSHLLKTSLIENFIFFAVIAIEPHNFKILPFLLYGYDTPQLENITIPAIAFSIHNFKLLPISQLKFFGFSNPT